jgi:hypothetical protein
MYGTTDNNRPPPHISPKFPYHYLLYKTPTLASKRQMRMQMQTETEMQMQTETRTLGFCYPGKFYGELMLNRKIDYRITPP